jgi:Glycosyltransferase family 92
MSASDRAGKAYLAVCTMYRDHAEYLREWIEFHRLVGAERFFLYDNRSTDDHLAILAPYLEEGTVAVHDWPNPQSVERGVPWGLIPAFDDCLEKHRADARWIAFIDVDEFLFPANGGSLAEVLARYERWPGVCVSRLDFGTSGHLTKPPGLVVENYLRRKSYPPGAQIEIKSIVDPMRATACFNAHRFLYAEGVAVDENEQPIPGPPFKKATVTAQVLRINHYATKSEEEYRRKREQWTSAGRDAGWPPKAWFDDLETEHDDAITCYLPALRERLAGVGPAV